MIEPGQSLQDRYTSSYPVSIGTSLALESLLGTTSTVYDPQRPIPLRVNLSQYPGCFINMLTLFRNLVQSFDKNVFLKTPLDDLVLALSSEISVIETLFQVEGYNTTQPLFYSCSYNSLLKIDNRIKIREDRTEWQKFFKTTYLKALDKLLKQHDIIITDTVLPKKVPKALILTHVPYDLLNYKQFSKLDLLESNTGKLKPRTQWNTKYFPIVGSDTSHLPFHKALLLILGDKVLIHPSPMALRRVIIDVSVQGQWTVATTIDKIKLDIEMYVKDHYVRDFLKSL